MTPEQIDFVKMAKKMGMSTDEIMSKIKSNDTSLGSPDQQAQPQAQKKTSGFADYFNNFGGGVGEAITKPIAGFGDIGKNLAESIPTGVINTGRKLLGKNQMYQDVNGQRVLTNPDGTQAEVKPNIWDKVQGGMKNYGEMMGTDPNSGAFKAGKVVSQGIQLATPTGEAAALGSLLSKYPQLATLAKNSPKLTEALKLAVEGGLTAQKTSMVTDGKPATLGQTVVGAVLNPAIAGAGSLIGKGAEKYIGRATKIETPEEIAGKISQLTDPKKLEKVTKAIKDLPDGQIGTYADLEKTTSDLLTQRAKAQDTHLGTVKTIFTPKNTDTIVQGSTSKIKDNFVKSALNDLSSLYKATRDSESLVRIKDLAAKFKKDGLSAKELNDLAREFGSKEKAFNKAGDLLKGNTAISNENVRKGLKDLLRKNLPDETSKNLDTAYSQMSTLNKSAQDMVKKVNKTKNTTEQPGLLEGAGETVGNLVNTVSGGGFKGVLKGLAESNAGKKTLNNLGIEDNLLKNIQKLKNYDDYVKNQKMNGKAIEITKQAFDKIRKALVMGSSKIVGSITNNQ